MQQEQNIQTEVLRFAAADGRPLTGTLYAPLLDNQRCVLVNGATAVKRSYYDGYARYLAAAGFTVLTYDYRGIGDSCERPVQHETGTMRQWGEADTAGAIAFLTQHRPAHRLLVVGHSAGGQLFGLAANNRQASGLLAVSSQSGYWRLWPWPRRLVLALCWFVLMPALTRLCSRFPARRLGLGSSDLPPGVAREWARWCRHPEYIVDDAGLPLRRYFNAYDGNILAYTITDDWMAPCDAVRALLAFYGAARIERQDLEPSTFGLRSLGHFGYFRSGNRALWPAGAAWLLAQ